jgi:hypothetical protein
MRLTAVLISILIITSCSRQQDPPPNNNGGGNGGGNNPSLSTFTVTVIERTWNMLVIEWTASVPSNTSDTVKYKWSLNNVLVDSNLLVFTDTMMGPGYANSYTGQVTAYTKGGLSRTVTFNLEALDGSILISQPDYYHSVSSLELFTPMVLSWVEWNQQNLYTYSAYYAGSTPVISNDTIFYISGQQTQGSIIAFRLTDGFVFYNRILPYSITSGMNPTYYQGNLYFTTSDGLVSLKASNGTENWKFTTTLPLTNNPACNPVIANGRLYAGTHSNSGYVVCINLANGAPYWYYPLNQQLCNTPVPYNGTIIFTAGNETHAIDGISGLRVWLRNVGDNFHSPVITENVLMVNNYNNGMFGLNPLTGATIWSKDYPAPERTSSVAAGNGCFFFSIRDVSGKSRIRAIRATTGEMVWDKLTFSPFLANFIYANGMVFAYEDFYGMWQFNANSGRIEAGLTGYVNFAFRSPTYLARINGITHYNPENGNNKF